MKIPSTSRTAELSRNFAKVFAGFLIGIFTAYLFSGYAHNSTAAVFDKALIISLIGASLSFFLDFTFFEGNIFEGWMHFINKKFHKDPAFGFLWKPLGGCVFCMNIWITAFWFFTLGSFYFDLSWWIFLPVAAVSHVILNTFLKLRS